MASQASISTGSRDGFSTARQASKGPPTPAQKVLKAVIAGPVLCALSEEAAPLVASSASCAAVETAFQAAAAWRALPVSASGQGMPKSFRIDAVLTAGSSMPR